jgi:hypothetical protein
MPVGMTLREKALYHQVHPWKLATDIGCEPVSLYFLWRHDLVVGLASHFIPPILASLLVIQLANLQPYRTSKTGAFLRAHMTRPVEAARLAGDIVMVAGAWFHRPWVIGLGLAMVSLAWLSGPLRAQWARPT